MHVSSESSFRHRCLICTPLSHLSINKYTHNLKEYLLPECVSVQNVFLSMTFCGFKRSLCPPLRLVTQTGPLHCVCTVKGHWIRKLICVHEIISDMIVQMSEDGILCIPIPDNCCLTNRQISQQISHIRKQDEVTLLNIPRPAERTQLYSLI